MRITIGTKTFDRGNSKEDRDNAAKAIMARVRCRYTPQARANAKAFRRGHDA